MYGLWRRRGVSLLLGISITATALTGCGGSIIRNASLDYVLDRVDPLSPVPEVSENVAIRHMEERNLKKYQIDGTDAFYILPNHRPAPDNILKFQVLDVIDGTTTIYAYQALIDDSVPRYVEVNSMDMLGSGGKIEMENGKFKYYSRNPLFDTTGLGDNPTEGIAEETENYNGTGWPDSQETVIVLMSYNTKTKEYKVFRSDVAPLDKTMNRKLDGQGLPTYGLQASSSDEIFSFVAQKLSSDKRRYFLYCNNFVYVYDDTGRMTYEKGLSSILYDNKLAYGSKEDKISLLSVVMDQNYFLYMTMMLQKEGVSITKETTEDDLEKEDGEIKQILYAVFETSMAENGYSQEPANCFISKNENFEKEVEEWMAVDGQTVQLEPGELEHMAVIQAAEVEKKWPPTFGDYIYSNSEYPFHLCSTFLDPNEEIDSELWEMISGSGAIADRLWITTNPDNHDKQGDYYAGYLPQSAGTGSRYYLHDPAQKNGRAIPAEWKEEDVLMTRTYTIEVEDEWDGTPISITKTDECIFKKEYRVTFPETCRINWSQDYYTKDLIYPSNGSGYLFSSTSKDSGQEIDTLFWKTVIGSAELANVPAKIKNALMIQEAEETMVVGVTTKGLLVIRGIHTDSSTGKPVAGNQFLIENANLNFGIGLEAGTTELLNSVRYGNSSPVLITSDSTRDSYRSDNFLVRKENEENFLYVAGLTHGLIKMNIDHRVTGSAGQIFSYPCYGLWQKEQTDSCYVLGFQNSEYSYTNEDMPCAKLYQVSLTDETAAANLVVSCLNKDAELRKKVISGGTEGIAAWNNMLKYLCIPPESMKQVKLYQEFLMDGERKAQSAILRFYELGQIPAADRGEKLAESIRECSYGDEIEQLMILMHADDEMKSTESESLVLEPFQIDPSETGSVYTEKLETEPNETKSKERQEAESVAESIAQKTIQEQQQAQIKQYSNKSSIRTRLEKAAGLDDTQWEKAMNEIAFDLNTPDTLEEFLKNRAVRSFAELAGISLRRDIRIRLETCKTQVELETLMAEYHLSVSMTSTLDSWTEQTNKPKESVEIAEEEDRQLQLLAIQECKMDYAKSCGRSWNAEMEVIWNQIVKEILEAFATES